MDLARAVYAAQIRCGVVAIADDGIGVAVWHLRGLLSVAHAVRDAATPFGEAGMGMLACYDDRKLHLSLARHAPAAQATLALLAVHPSHQRRGIGSALLRAGHDRFSSIALSTEDDRVVAFYERFGLYVVDTFETEGDTTWVLRSAAS